MLLDIEYKLIKHMVQNPNAHQLRCDEFPKYSKAQIKAAMRQLLCKGYIDKLTGDWGWDVITYNLTANGMFYKEYAAHMFFKDIIVPIVVSIITALVTMNLAI